MKEDRSIQTKEKCVAIAKCGSYNSFGQLDYRSLISAAETVTLPQFEPGTIRQRFIVSSIRRRDIACAEWPNVRSFIQLFELLDLIDNPLDVHAMISIAEKLFEATNPGAVNPIESRPRLLRLWEPHGQPRSGDRMQPTAEPWVSV